MRESDRFWLRSFLLEDLFEMLTAVWDESNPVCEVVGLGLRPLPAVGGRELFSSSEDAYSDMPVNVWQGGEAVNVVEEMFVGTGGVEGGDDVDV